jgi:putative transposase
MGRLPRVLLANRCAHCFIHAVDGIRFNEVDVTVFLLKLMALKEKHKFSILYFNIMSTHIHWVMQFSEDVSCGKIMGVIHTELAKAFNRSHERSGHLWRDRYKDVTIQEEDHFWSATTYVALNKMKAGMVKSLDKDLASSYGVYAFGKDDGITELAQEYLDLANTPEERQAEFRFILHESWVRFLDAKAWEHLEDDQEYLVAHGLVDVKKLLAMSDFEDEILAKIAKEDKSLHSLAKLFSKEALEAVKKLREHQKTLHKQLVQFLWSQGIPGRVANLFWAGQSFMVDFVESHRQSFGLPLPEESG